MFSPENAIPNIMFKISANVQVAMYQNSESPVHNGTRTIAASTYNTYNATKIFSAFLAKYFYAVMCICIMRQINKFKWFEYNKLHQNN